MSFKNKIFIITMIMLVLLGVSFASASQDDTLAGDDAGEVLTSTEDEIQTETFDDNNVSASNQDVLSENERTYNQLQNHIDNAVAGGATANLN